MQRHACVVGLILLAGITGRGARADEAPTIALQLNTSRIDAGTPVIAAVTIHNSTDKALDFPSPESGLFVTDSHGAALPRTRYGDGVHDNPPGALLLRPHETQQIALHINRLFDMTVQDKYTVKVDVTFEKQHILSNAVTVNLQAAASTVITPTIEAELGPYLHPAAARADGNTPPDPTLPRDMRDDALATLALDALAQIRDRLGDPTLSDAGKGPLRDSARAAWALIARLADTTTDSRIRRLSLHTWDDGLKPATSPADLEDQLRSADDGGFNRTILTPAYLALLQSTHDEMLLSAFLRVIVEYGSNAEIPMLQSRLTQPQGENEQRLVQASLDALKARLAATTQP